jgi:hypothetical protein
MLTHTWSTVNIPKVGRLSLPHMEKLEKPPLTALKVSQSEEFAFKQKVLCWLFVGLA